MIDDERRIACTNLSLAALWAIAGLNSNAACAHASTNPSISMPSATSPPGTFSRKLGRVPSSGFASGLASESGVWVALGPCAWAGAQSVRQPTAAALKASAERERDSAVVRSRFASIIGR